MTSQDHSLKINRILPRKLRIVRLDFLDSLLPIIPDVRCRRMQLRRSWHSREPTMLGEMTPVIEAVRWGAEIAMVGEEERVRWGNFSLWLNDNQIGFRLFLKLATFLFADRHHLLILGKLLQRLQIIIISQEVGREP